MMRPHHVDRAKSWACWEPPERQDRADVPRRAPPLSDGNELVSIEPRRFPPPVLQRLAKADEVEMLVPGDDGALTSRPIWIVVVDGVPYVRSYTGPRGKWWQRVLRDRQGVLRVGRTRVPFAAEPLTERELESELNRRVSEAYDEKYGGRWPQYVRTMLTPEIAATTLRLEPLP